MKLLGNIKWTSNQNWSENYSNSFDWYVDRDQNWYYNNKKLSGSAKILNGKLVIRVGGGYMIIEEFIATYADGEMAKIAKMSDDLYQQRFRLQLLAISKLLQMQHLTYSQAWSSFPQDN